MKQHEAHIDYTYKRAKLKIPFVKVFNAVLCLSLASMFNICDAKPKPVSKKGEIGLAELYAKFADSGYSSLSMPELNQSVAITGVVLGHTRSVVGGYSILSAGDESSPDEELARLGTRNSNEDKKMDALAVGARFSAVCVLGVTSGSSGGYMSLSNCVFK